MIYAPVFLMMALMLVGIPVAFAMGLAGLWGLYVVGGMNSVVGILSTTPFRTAASYTLTTVPLFTLMAAFITRSKIAAEVFQACYKWMGHYRGGVAIASVFANAGFGAMCGSANAAASAMSRVIIPEMQKLGYKDEMSSGVISIGGILSGLLPPSILMIVYGTATEVSIGRLLISGILPGFLLMVVMSLTIIVWTKVDPSVAPTAERFSWYERFISLKPVWKILVLLFLVTGSIYMGIGTPTECAALGAFGALCIGVLMGRLDFKEIKGALYDTTHTSVMIFTIIICAHIFGYYLALSRIPQNIMSVVSAMDVNRWFIMIGIVSVFLFLGLFMDQIAVIMLVIPIVFPLVVRLNFDPVWFGVITVICAGIGLSTPPMGMAVFIVSAASGIPIATCFKGAAPFIISCFITMIIIMIFPVIATLLPSMM
jgi:tripartite ATP-independent transporter DctM subunit